VPHRLRAASVKQEGAMKTRVREEGPCHVVAIVGSADVNASATLREALLGAVEAGKTRIVCDLSETDFICSDALGVMVRAFLKARARGVFVHLAHPQASVRQVLETTRLDHLFEVFPDVASAIK